MSPRRLRSSMNLVVIMPPVGIQEPQWSRDAPAGAAAGTGVGAGAPTSGTVVNPRPPVDL
jgi:hypothetical protein